MKPIDVIGVSCDLGGALRGSALAPQTLIEDGLLVQLRADSRSVHYMNLRECTLSPEAFRTTQKPSGRVHHRKKIETVLSVLAPRVFASFQLGHTPLVLGGDHSLVIASIGQALAVYGDRLGVVWLDAHCDAHTPKTSPSHHANGMPLATLLGHGPKGFRAPISGRTLESHQVLHIGRGETDCEPEEIDFLEKRNVEMFPMSFLRGTDGMFLMGQRLKEFCESFDAIWVSTDIDVVLARDAPGVDFPSITGMTREELLAIARIIADSRLLVGADLVEYNPTRDHVYSDGTHQTAQLLIDVATMLFSRV